MQKGAAQKLPVFPWIGIPDLPVAAGDEFSTRLPDRTLTPFGRFARPLTA